MLPPLLPATALINLSKQALNNELLERYRRYRAIRFPRGADYNTLLVIPQCVWSRLSKAGQRIFGVITREPDLWLYTDSIKTGRAYFVTLEDGTRKIWPRNPAYVTPKTRCILHTVGKCSLDASDDPQKLEAEEIAEARLLERFYPDLMIECDVYDKRRRRFPMRKIRAGDVLEITLDRNQNFREWVNSTYDWIDEDEPNDPRYESGQDEAGLQHDQFRHSYQDDSFYENDGEYRTLREEPGPIDSFQRILAVTEHLHPDLDHHQLLNIARKTWRERNERTWCPREQFIREVGRWRYENV